MSLLVLVIGGLATWRLSYMIVREDGPMQVFTRLRAYLATKQKRSGGVYDLVSCIYCTSIYIGAFIALWGSQSVFEFFVGTLSFSAIAVLTERLTT